MDMSQYRDLFISESREHLRAMNELIVALEKEAGNGEKIDSLFRSAHSIKGMAASMGYGDIAELAHKIEDLMDKVRKGIMEFESGVADLLLAGADCMEAMILDVEQGGTGNRDIAGLLQNIAGYTPPVADVAAPSPSSDQAAPIQPASMAKQPEARQKHAESRQTVRVKTEILDHLINTTGELITNKHRLMNVGKEIGSTRLNEALVELSTASAGALQRSDKRPDDAVFGNQRPFSASGAGPGEEKRQGSHF